MKFPADGLRRISVNCFGFGGTNAHGILDDARTFLKQRGLAAYHNTVDPSGPGLQDDGPPASESKAGSSTSEGASPSSWDDLASQSSTSTVDDFSGPYLFPFSTRHRDGIVQLAAAHVPYLNKNASSPALLRQYSYTLYSRRSRLDYRAFVVAKSVPELTQKMAKIAGSSITRSSIPKESRPALIFCGQGAQWPRMAAELMSVDIFAESIRSAARHMRAIDGGLNLETELSPDKDQDGCRIHRPELAQPATTAVQVALVDLLRACGVAPVAVAGHSSGEIAAAYAAGILSREDAWEIAFYRGQCAAAVKSVGPTLRGRMLAVGLSRSAVREYVERVRPGSVVVACINSPQLVTLSGDEDAILAIKEDLDGRSVFNALVAVETAYHSHHMKVVSQQYGKAIRNVKPRESASGVAMYSSVRGGKVAGHELDAAYWVENMASPVEFEKAVTAMMETAPNLLIEVSPHRVWGKALKQILDAVGFKNAPVSYFSVLERGKDAVETVLQLVGDLFLRGDKVSMDWFYRR